MGRCEVLKNLIDDFDHWSILSAIKTPSQNLAKLLNSILESISI